MNVIAVIPAYNEEKTIGDVLAVLQEVSLISRIIVVSDGSTDNTVEVAGSYDVDVVVLKENRGKGGALQAGLENTRAKVILFLDADLIGLTTKHVENLVFPVLQDRADMTIGIFEKGRRATDFAQKMAPKLSGQRAIKYSLIEQISGLDVARFGVEVALNRFMDSAQIRVEKVSLPDMSHVMKEEKLGMFKGMAARMKMYWEITKSLTSVDSLKIK